MPENPQPIRVVVSSDDQRWSQTFLAAEAQNNLRHWGAHRADRVEPFDEVIAIPRVVADALRAEAEEWLQRHRTARATLPTIDDPQTKAFLEAVSTTLQECVANLLHRLAVIERGRLEGPIGDPVAVEARASVELDEHPEGAYTATTPCQEIDVDGEPVRVQGSVADASPQAREALQQVIRAAREHVARQEGEQP